jgi:hypothetical protein
MQYEAAKTGNVTMLIWLGKQWLAQADKVESNVEVTGEGGGPIVIERRPGDSERPHKS